MVGAGRWKAAGLGWIAVATVAAPSLPTAPSGSEPEVGKTAVAKISPRRAVESALARATPAAPRLLEVGANDFRISDMGPGANTIFGAFTPAVAYNATDNEYLVVWRGDDDTGTLVDEEFEIFGQRIDAATGAEIGSDFRISDMGFVDGSPVFGASVPAVAYNATDNEYLVVWRGDDDSGALVDDELEIFGQRIQANTGFEIGTNDFRISDMGSVDGNPAFGAIFPAVAYNATDNEYLVVWYGDDDTGALVAGEFEIFGQRIQANTGFEIGTNDFRISDMGPDGNTVFAAALPAVAYNATDNEYLVVWAGDDDTGALVDDELEIFGQRIEANTGFEIGTDFRVSDMGFVDGNPAFGALFPTVAYNATDNEYLVVWRGDDDTGALVDGELEIFGQRIDAATGAEIGSDSRISDMGPDGNTAFNAEASAVAYDATDNEYLVVWQGDDDTGVLVDEEFEIFGQRIEGNTGFEIGTNDFRVSDMGPNGNIAFEAEIPAVAYNATDNEYLVVWAGDDDSGVLVDEELEIFGQRLAISYLRFFIAASVTLSSVVPI